MWPSSPLPLGEREASEASRERAVASLSNAATSLSPALRADPLPQPAKRPEGERGRKEAAARPHAIPRQRTNNRRSAMSQQFTADDGSIAPGAEPDRTQLMCPCCGSRLSLRGTNGTMRLDLEQEGHLLPAAGSM